MTIVLAYSSGYASSVAMHWLAEHHGADIVTVTVDVGQGEDLAALRWRATAAGAARAHAIDARDELARAFLQHPVPGADGWQTMDAVTRAVVARTLIEIARIEGTSVVAHGSADPAFSDAIRALDSSVTVLAPAIEWQMSAEDVAVYARAHGIRVPEPSQGRVVQNVWGRMVSWNDGDAPPAAARTGATTVEPAVVDILFDRGMPVSLNGVTMSPVELLESLALLGGGQGVGYLETSGNGRRIVYDAPAAAILSTARDAAEGRSDVVRVLVSDGRCSIQSSELVRHA